MIIMKTLSVVCARGGSKGLANKCIKKLAGKMLIEYSIEYSLSLGGEVKTVVSTDIGAVIDYCESNNIEYIRRDDGLCGDDVKIDHALADAIEKKGQGCEYCSLVYGNIPIRYPKMFHDAVNFLRKHADYDAVISMQNVEKFHPEWMFFYDEKILPEEKKGHHRRQSLPQKMIHDGHILLFRKEKFYKRYKGLVPCEKINGYSIYGKKIKPLINNELIIDIDTAKDLRLAEAVVSLYKKRT